MIKYNTNFDNLKPSYLFREVSSRVNAFKQQNPNADIIRLGIGDVTRPLEPAVVEAFSKAALEMGVKETFRGYDDGGRGYGFLIDAIIGYYKGFGVDVEADEVFVSDGAKSDSGNIGDIFDADNTVLITDPVFPVYVDTNIMAGRKIIFANSNEENGFGAMPDFSQQADIIYLCSPNNPTGYAYTAEQLAEWVSYALENRAVIIYDAAYEAFISDNSGGNPRPRSIFAVPGARECAIEICSLSKTAGFTGTRCGYTVIPKELKLYGGGGTVSCNQIWNRRQSSKFNGVSYPVQRAAEAVFSPLGLKQTRDTIDYYRGNAKIIADAFTKLGVKFTGGVHAPYIWFKNPSGGTSWELFDNLLGKANVVGTPGSGFGANGEGWFRLTAFNSRENTAEAMRRVAGYFGA